MMPTPYSSGNALHQTIQSICSCSLTELDLHNFVTLCVRFAIATLRTFENRGYRIREWDGGKNALDDLAFDCIADLFERNATGEFVHLAKYFKPFIKQNPSEEACVIQLRRLVWNRTRQRLFRVFRERDPESAKIWRAVKQFGDGRGTYRLIERLGRDWLYCRKNVKGLVFLEDISHNPHIILPVNGDFRPADSVPQLIEKIFRSIQKNFPSPIAIEVGEVVHQIRIYRNTLSRKIEQEMLNRDPVDLDWSEENFKKQIEAVRCALIHMTDQVYARKGKMDPAVIEGMKCALGVMLDDLMDGGLVQSQFQYLKDFLPDLNDQDYRNYYRTRFEYLVRLLKIEISKIFF